MVRCEQVTRFEEVWVREAGVWWRYPAEWRNHPPYSAITLGRCGG